MSDFLCLHKRPPRAGQVVPGLLMDDFVLLDPVPKVPRALPGEPDAGAAEPPGVEITEASRCGVC